MANIASDSISVFPTVNKPVEGFSRSQRLFTEENVRDIANMVNSKDSYVIQTTTLTKNNTGVSCVEFCLDGYHVFAEISAIVGAQDDGKLVYAKAVYSDGNLQGDNEQLLYTGITFTVQASTDTAPTDALLLGTITSNGQAKTITIAEESKFMYDGNRVDLIDGGEA